MRMHRDLTHSKDANNQYMRIRLYNNYIETTELIEMIFGPEAALGQARRMPYTVFG